VVYNLAVRLRGNKLTSNCPKNRFFLEFEDSYWELPFDTVAMGPSAFVVDSWRFGQMIGQRIGRIFVAD